MYEQVYGKIWEFRGIRSANPKLAKRYFKLKCFFQLANKFSWLDFLYNIDIVLW